MTRSEAKDQLATIIREKQGCKATDLLGSKAVLEIILADHPLLDLIEELVSEGRLVEVEYYLADLPYRVKSFLLPEGTTIHGDPRKETTHA